MFDILAIIAGLLISPAAAQNVTCATRPAGDSSNACASTAFVHNVVAPPIGVFTSLTVNSPSYAGSSLNVKAPAGIPVLAYFESAGIADSAGAGFTLKDQYQGTRGIHAGNPAFAGDGDGPAINFQSWSRRSSYLDSVQLNCGLISAAANNEQGLCDWAMYRNGTSEVMLTFDASLPAVFPGNTNAVYDLGQLSHQWNVGYFQTLANSGNVFVGGFATLGGNLNATSVVLSDGTKTVTPVTCSANQFVNAVNGSGVPTCATPTTGSSTAAAGSSGQFQTNSAGSLAGVTISGDVAISGTTGIATLATVPITKGGTGLTTLPTGLLKGAGTSAITAAVAGTDYLAPTGSAAGLTGLTSAQVTTALGFTPVNKAGDTLSGALFVAAAFPQIGLVASGNTTDNKFWRTYVDGSGNFILGTLNDAFTTGASPLVISRSGITPTLATLAAPLYINTAIGTGAPFTFAGITQYNAQLIDVTASNASAAEGGLLVNVNSNAGTNATNYKAGMVSQVTVNSGGGMGFGANFLCNLGSALANTATTGCNGMEIDINNADATRSGNVWTSNANRSVGLLINGSGLFQNNTALEITSARTGGPLWEVGLRFSQNAGFGVAAIASATVADEVTSNNSYLDTGSHIYGLALSGTYSGAAIIVQGSAGVTCASITAATVTVKGGIVTHC